MWRFKKVSHECSGSDSRVDHSIRDAAESFEMRVSNGSIGRMPSCWINIVDGQAVFNQDFWIKTLDGRRATVCTVIAQGAYALDKWLLIIFEIFWNCQKRNFLAHYNHLKFQVLLGAGCWSHVSMLLNQKRDYLKIVLPSNFMPLDAIKPNVF